MIKVKLFKGIPQMADKTYEVIDKVQTGLEKIKSADKEIIVTAEQDLENKVNGWLEENRFKNFTIVDKVYYPVPSGGLYIHFLLLTYDDRIGMM